MNETISTLLARRSIRRFTPQSVSPEELELVLQCGLYAASGGNHQVARLTAITDRGLLDGLAALVRGEFLKMEPQEGQYQNTAILNARNHPNYDFSFHAPVLVIVTAPKGWPNGMADCASALQNMQVAAFSLGLGACWVNQLHWLTENTALRAHLAPFGLREDEEIYGSMALGHPAVPAPPAAPRKAGRITYLP